MAKPNMANLFKQAQKVQEELEKVQEALEDMTVEASSGGGIVTVTANGKQKVLTIKIDDEVIKSEDTEMLEDLVVAAVNKALESAGKMAEEELGNVTKGMIPPGLNIPGF